MTRAEFAKLDALFADGQAICSQCGATWQTYGDACTAALDVACDGFNTIEVALGNAPYPESVGNA